MVKKYIPKKPPTYVEYAAFKKRKPREARSLGDHAVTTQDFIERCEAAARYLGKIQPVKCWSGNDFAQKMFDIASDERMIHRAMESLKGEAAGIDGIRLEDSGRYVVYRQWLTACGMYGEKAPGYNETLFPDIGNDVLYFISLFCNPRMLHKAVEVDLDGMRWKVASDYEPLNDREFSENRAALMQYRDAPPNLVFETPVEHLRLFLIKARNEHMKPYVANTQYALTVFIDEQTIKNHLPKAGVDGAAFSELWQAFTAGFRNFVRDRHLYNAKIFFRSYEPISKLLNAQKKPEILTTAVQWNTARWIRDLMKKIPANGKGYKPGDMRVVEIPKPDGGVRRLSLPSIIDRVVAKSALLTLQPVMEEVFLPSSVGCRYDRDRFDALAALNEYYPVAPGKWILTADIKKAFDHVPHDILLKMVAKYVPNANMTTLLERIIRRPGFENGIGIAQGDPLSPLFLNMLLHDCLDAPLDPFMKNKGLLYFRYVDDLCVFGMRTREEAEAVLRQLQELLRPIGLEMHLTPPKTQVIDLTVKDVHSLWEKEYYLQTEESEIDRYLGIGLKGGADGRLLFFLPSSWKERIRDRLRPDFCAHF